jgi:hypothetical protein
VFSHIEISPETWAAVVYLRRVISLSLMDGLGSLQTLALARLRAFAAHFPHVETANADNEMLHFI